LFHILFDFCAAKGVLFIKIIIHFPFSRLFQILALPSLLPKEGIMAQDLSTHQSGSITQGELP
jgi:hypothetical protein